VNRERIAHRLDAAAFGVFCILLLVLPSIEAPKTIALVCFTILAAARFLVDRSAPSGATDPLEWSLLAVLLASAISTAVNWPIANGLKGLVDTAMYVSGCWCVYRSGWSDRRRTLIAVMIATGVILGLVRGAIDVATGRHHDLQFHSAGVVTQSSIYLGMAVVMVGGILVTSSAADRQLSAGQRFAWSAVALLMVAALVLMASRGAILAVMLTWLFVLAAVRRPGPIVATFAASAILALAVYATYDRLDHTRLGEKISQSLAAFRTGTDDVVRPAMWRIGVERVAQGDSFIFGIGPRNFSAIDLSTLSIKLPADVSGQKLNHAHNLFLNKLVEEGVVGLAAFLSLLGVVAWRLAQDRREQRPVEWTWCAALGAVVVPVVAGSFNTPWYQEHALLAMILIGLYCAPRLTATLPPVVSGSNGKPVSIKGTAAGQVPTVTAS